MTVCLRFRFIAHREQETPDNQRCIYVLKDVSGAQIKIYWVLTWMMELKYFITGIPKDGSFREEVIMIW